MNINKDRGVTIRKHPTGAQIFMYKDTPGVFLTAFGTEVAPEMAAEAGFDVKFLVREREKREKMRAAMAEVEAMYNEGGPAREVLEDRGGYKLVSIGMGRHAILAPDDTPMNNRPLTKDEAVAAFDKIAPKSDED